MPFAISKLILLIPIFSRNLLNNFLLIYLIFDIIIENYMQVYMNGEFYLFDFKAKWVWAKDS